MRESEEAHGSNYSSTHSQGILSEDVGKSEREKDSRAKVRAGPSRQLSRARKLVSSNRVEALVALSVYKFLGGKGVSSKRGEWVSKNWGRSKAKAKGR